MTIDKPYLVVSISIGKDSKRAAGSIQSTHATMEEALAQTRTLMKSGYPQSFIAKIGKLVTQQEPPVVVEDVS